MTVKQAILSFPGLSDIPDNFIEKLMLDRSIDGAVEYSASLKADVELCAADGYVFMLNSPDFAEGSLSITIKRGELKSTAVRLYRANGEGSKADNLSSIKAVSRTSRW